MNDYTCPNFETSMATQKAWYEFRWVCKDLGLIKVYQHFITGRVNKGKMMHLFGNDVNMDLAFAFEIWSSNKYFSFPTFALS